MALGSVAGWIRVWIHLDGCEVWILTILLQNRRVSVSVKCRKEGFDQQQDARLDLGAAFPSQL